MLWSEASTVSWRSPRGVKKKGGGEGQVAHNFVVSGVTVRRGGEGGGRRNFATAALIALPGKRRPQEVKSGAAAFAKGPESQGGRRGREEGGGRENYNRPRPNLSLAWPKINRSLVASYPLRPSSEKKGKKGGKGDRRGGFCLF